MVKELSELTLEELWLLFPIVLKAYNPAYPKWYQEIETELLACIGTACVLRINHIGSTAVIGLLSKPTIDILLEVHAQSDFKALAGFLKGEGWTLMQSREEPYKSYVFNKGYSKYGFEEKVYHLHLRPYGDWDELYFRDYLREHEEIAVAYGKLKSSLLAHYKNNRDGYTEAKTSFVKDYTEKARQSYLGRYVPSDAE